MNKESIVELIEHWEQKLASAKKKKNEAEDEIKHSTNMLIYWSEKLRECDEE